MVISAGPCVVRSWHANDAASLVEQADNPAIWRNVRDAFPSPYTSRDAAEWLAHVMGNVPETDFAIDVGGHAVGAIGFVLQNDIHRLSAELGYWLGERYWGAGIASAAVRAVVPYAFQTYGLVRIFARVFSTNLASSRVLEKAGFSREATLRCAAVKEGRVLDEHLYVTLQRH